MSKRASHLIASAITITLFVMFVIVFHGCSGSLDREREFVDQGEVAAAVSRVEFDAGGEAEAWGLWVGLVRADDHEYLLASRHGGGVFVLHHEGCRSADHQPPQLAQPGS